MKNSNDIVGNRTRDLPACSAVPQPTAPPRVPLLYAWIICNYPTVLKEKNMEKQKEYNLRYPLAKVRTT
jgi:hypothetical protein